jgi:hypothetical protein
MFPDLTTLLAAFIGLGALLLVMRWVFAPSRPRPKRRGAARLASSANGAAQQDLGLLAPLVHELPRARANSIRALLGDAGIRTSLSIRRNGTVDVLVFREDLERASTLLPPDGGRGGSGGRGGPGGRRP